MKKICIAIIAIVFMVLSLGMTGCFGTYLFRSSLDRDTKGQANEAGLEPKEEAPIEDVAENGAKDAPESAADKSAQSDTTWTFDNSNAEFGCSVWASIAAKYEGYEGRENEATMILSTSTSWMEDDPTEFGIKFDLDKNTITGFFKGSYIVEEKEEGAYDAATVSANILNGTVVWDAEQKVWMFEGDVEMQVNLDIVNKVGSSGFSDGSEELYFGEALFDIETTGKLTGASGEHQRLYHGELEDYGEFLDITYEGDHTEATENAKLRALNISCWMRLPYPESLESKFPSGP